MELEVGEIIMLVHYLYEWYLHGFMQETPGHDFEIDYRHPVAGFQ